MARPAPGSPWQEIGRRPPYIIGHRGNSLEQIAHFLSVSADFVETDLWVHGDRFESRHERALYPLPILYEKWYLRFRSESYNLLDAAEALGDRSWLFLDLKNGGDSVVPLIHETRKRLPDLPISASGSDWGTLRALGDGVPNIDIFYSMEVPERLDLFLSVIERDPRPLGVSIRAGLLSRGLVDHLHGLGLRVVAWTVDEADRARRLAGWGVDAITTHHPAEIREAVTL